MVLVSRVMVFCVSGLLLLRVYHVDENFLGVVQALV